MHFLFNDILYKQVDGVAMGSPLGPTLANAFMCHWEEKWLRNCPASFKPVLYRRYVDDTFLIFDSPHQIDLFLNYLNSQHENIEFTCDKESDSRLPFLDINVTRGDTFSTSIYRKHTFTGLLSKFSSFCPLKYKENLISTLVFRGYKLNSTFESFHKEIEFLKNILKLNGYPLAFIEKLIKKTLNKFYKVSDPEPLDTSVPIEEKPVFFSSYFLGSFSDKLSKDLKYRLIRPVLDLVFRSSTRMLLQWGVSLGSKTRFLNRARLASFTNILAKAAMLPILASPGNNSRFESLNTRGYPITLISR